MYQKAKAAYVCCVAAKITISRTSRKAGNPLGNWLPSTNHSSLGPVVLRRPLSRVMPW